MSFHHNYQNIYTSSDEYCWGIVPSQMCLDIIKLMPPDWHVNILDIGCGEGKDAVFLAKCGYSVSAFDISEAGVEKLKRLSSKSGVYVHAYTRDICNCELHHNYDIIYSSGALHYIKPELRDEIMNSYKIHTNENGLHIFNVFVDKPFVAPPPENEEHSYFWHSGELLSYYRDWYIEYSSEIIFDCDSSGIPHKHAMNIVYARKIQQNLL